jgi:hypothetical protein
VNRWPSYNGGTFQVTAFGTGNAYCKAGNTFRDWNDTYVDVFCFNGSNGSPIDSMFDLVYDTMSPNALKDSAFTFDDQPTTSPYNPSWDTYTADIVPRTDDAYCPYYEPGATTIIRNSTGKYSVFFPGITIGNTSLFHSSAYGSGPETCGNAGASDYTYLGVPGLLLGVNCVSFSGTPVDTEFMVSYAADGVIGIN